MRLSYFFEGRFGRQAGRQAGRPFVRTCRFYILGRHGSPHPSTLGQWAKKVKEKIKGPRQRQKAHSWVRKGGANYPTSLYMYGTYKTNLPRPHELRSLTYNTLNFKKRTQKRNYIDNDRLSNFRYVYSITTSVQTFSLHWHIPSSPPARPRNLTNDQPISRQQSGHASGFTEVFKIRS